VNNAAAILAAMQTVTGGAVTVKRKVLNAVTGTAQDLIAAVASKSIQVIGGHLTFDVAGGVVTILDAATPIDYLSVAVGTYGAIGPDATTRPTWVTTAGNALKVTTQATQTVSGVLDYIEV
jgi:hypothetical protein